MKNQEPRTKNQECILKCICKSIDIDCVVSIIEGTGITDENYKSAMGNTIPYFDGEKKYIKHFLLTCGDDFRYFGPIINTKTMLGLSRLPIKRINKSNVIAAFINSYWMGDRIWNPETSIDAAGWKDIMMSAYNAGDPVIIIGDSHSSVYRRSIFVPKTEYAQELNILPIHLLCLGGSARGLSNSSSRSQYGNKIKSIRDMIYPQIKKNTPIIFKFGQVDIEFVYNHKRIIDKKFIFDLSDYIFFVNKVIDDYLNYVKFIFPDRNVIIASVFPPTLSDEHWREGYKKAGIISLTEKDRRILDEDLEKLEIPDWEQRTVLHEIFNKILREKSSLLDLKYLNDFTPFLQGNKVSEEFIRPQGGNDHHLDHESTFQVIRNLYEKNIFRNDVPVTRNKKFFRFHPMKLIN